LERDEFILQTFGERLKELRLKKDMSQVDVAFEAGVDPRTINRIENGKQDPRLSVVVAIALALECKIDDLIKLNP